MRLLTQTPRLTSGPAVLLLLLFAAGPARAQETGKVAPPAEPERHCSESGDRQHVLGAIADFGGSHFTPGARYHRTNRSAYGCDGLGFLSWFGYGADVRLPDLRGLLGYASARAGGLGDAMGFGLEAGVGPGTDFNRVLVSGYAGLFLSMYYFDVGLAYQFPIGFERPDWLVGPHIALRIHVPVATTDKYERDVPTSRQH